MTFRTWWRRWTVGAAAAFAGALPPAGPAALAQEPVVLPSTFQQPLHSKVNGVDYQLTIVLPPGYEKDPTTRYPVLYVMDGNRWARLLAVLLPRLIENDAYRPIIIVGVDYPGKTGRYQDYGPVSQRYFPVPKARGAENFLRVLKEEVIPLVERTYRADPGDRGIGGHSLGGFFSAYALLNASDTFRRFWISSPSLFYDDEVLFRDLDQFRRRKIDRPLQVFTDVGADELPAMQSALERFDARVSEAQPGKIILRSLTVSGADHVTAPPGALSPALEHLYLHRPSVIPATLDLLRFAGDYRLDDGTVLSFVTDGRTLLFRDDSVDYETGSLVPLSAIAPNRFFRRGSRTDYEFPRGAGPAKLVRVLEGEEGGHGRDAPRISPVPAPRATGRAKVGVP